MIGGLEPKRLNDLITREASEQLLKRGLVDPVAASAEQIAHRAA